MLDKILDSGPGGLHEAEAADGRMPDGEAVLGLEERLRRLAFDNEDLRFECSRLKASLERAQAEIACLTERGTMLQHRLDRIHRLAPRWSTRALSLLRSRVVRR